MAAIDDTYLYKHYKGKWVGLKKDRKTVVASGKTIQEVMDKAAKEGYKRPTLFRVPTKVTFYAGSAL